ncbi:MAG: T9SS type A sorting domain-containing protein [Bacteroidetes bacterium]|nr:T9SS type A sorting domain-containing protein [Bacteroidota bacterium]
MFYGEILWAQTNVLKFYQEAVKYPDLLERIDAFALHNYDTDGIKVGGASGTQWTNTYLFASQYKKEMWMSETSGYANDVTLNGLLGYCGALYNALFYGNVNLWCHLANGAGDVEKQHWYALKVTQKIKANSMRCDAISSDAASILSLGFTNFNNQTVAAMLMNISSQDKVVKLSGSGLPVEMDVYTTGPGKDAVLLGKFTKSNNYTLTLPATSISVAIGNAVITKVAEERVSPAHAFTLYPNPAKEELTVRYAQSYSGNENVEIIITDMLSRQVQKVTHTFQAETSEMKLDISGLKNGLYFIQVVNEANEILTEKLMINKN